MLKKLFALVVSALLLLGVLAGCAASTGESNAGPTTNTSNNSSPSNSSNNGNQDGGNAAQSGTEIDAEDIVEINVVFASGMTNEEHIQAVEDAINAVTEKRIGVHINFLPFANVGRYGTSVILSISSGVSIDLASFVPIPGYTLHELKANGTAMEVGQYMDSVPGLYEVMAPLREAIEFGDGIYGFPALRQKSPYYYLYWKKSSADALGIDSDLLNCKTWADLESLFPKILDAGYYPFGGHQTLAGGYFNVDSTNIHAKWFDGLGDALYMIYGTDEGKVSSVWGSEEFINQSKLFADWYQKGYVWPDTPYTDTMPDTLMRNNTIFFTITPSEFGAASTFKAQLFEEASVIEIGRGQLNTSACVDWGVFVPTTAEEPEAALKFLELIYTDPEMENLVVWGIEGSDYVINENGEACYPEGVTDKNSQIYHYNDYAIGNSFIALPWDGAGADFRALAKNDLDTAEKSKYLGFTQDASGLADTLATISAVMDEYKASLYSGLYTEELYKECMEKLNVAGINDYVDAIQAQLDAWMSAH